jgi:hypothetical protein
MQLERRTDAVPSLVLHSLQLGQERAEQLELAGIADLSVGSHGLDLREQEVFGSRVAGQLIEPLVPGHQLGILIR